MWDDQRTPPPKGGIVGRPNLETLRADSVLVRIHLAGRGACEFNHTVPVPGEGGRFDTCDAAYGHLYAAEGIEGAVAETVMRNIALEDPGPRQVPFDRVRGRLLSAVRLTRNVRLASLHGAHPAAFGQGPWLTKCEEDDYALTREWARALRESAPKAAGFVWRARHDEDALAYVLWSDRAKDAIEPLGDSIPIDADAGLNAVRKVLLDRHNAVLLR